MIIIDLFYDLLNLDIPNVYDSFEATLKSTCKIHFNDFFIIYSQSLDSLWDLKIDDEEYTYVAGEGAAKLPRLSPTR